VTDKITLAKNHLARLVDLKGEEVGVYDFRQQASFYLKGIPRAARTKAGINECTTQAEMDNLFDDFLEQTLAREAQTAVQ
jgi:tRNA-dihydrouridine synthase